MWALLMTEVALLVFRLPCASNNINCNCFNNVKTNAI